MGISDWAMANKVLKQWGASATVEQETVRAAVVGLAEGKLKKVPGVPADTRVDQIRFAPRFSKGRASAVLAGSNHGYTPDTIATYLGWNLDKVQHILRVLEAQETSPELA